VVVLPVHYLLSDRVLVESDEQDGDEVASTVNFVCEDEGFKPEEVWISVTGVDLQRTITRG